MNNRIEVLIKSMGIIPEDEHYDVAELIVKECASIAQQSGNITNKGEQAKAEAERIYYKIQKHFGVEK